MDRRHFLGAMPAAALAAALPLATARAAGASPAISSAGEAEAVPVITPLAGRLWLIAGLGGNVTVFDAPEGVLLVDGGSPRHSARLLHEVQALTGRQGVHTLFNTHWHHDQTGSNDALGRSGTRIIAHEYTRLWLTTDVESRWEGRTYQPLPKHAQPSQTFYTTGALEFGGERIEYGHLGQAHTDGDLYVYFRKADVLVAGDVVAVGRFPVPDPASNGWIGGLATAAAKLTELAGEGTRIIPGAGAPQPKAHVVAEAKMLDTLRKRLAQLLAQGLSATEMIEARPAAEFEAEWGDPSLLIRNSYPGLAHRARELGVSIV
jgi:glyoxylase-like metal-dependent hydrolase (beta-lactamase superfamily II)